MSLTSSENKTTFETHCEIDEYFYSSINAEMLTIAVRTHADSSETDVDERPDAFENLMRAISVEKLGL